jgi:hypothetical protein
MHGDKLHKLHERRMQPLCIVGTAVAMQDDEMYSPHLSQRKGIAVREHRKLHGQDGQCAAGEISFATRRAGARPARLYFCKRFPAPRACFHYFTLLCMRMRQAFLAIRATAHEAVPKRRGQWRLHQQSRNAPVFSVA